jgi:hypothetical protein
MARTKKQIRNEAKKLAKAQGAYSNKEYRHLKNALVKDPEEFERQYFAVFMGKREMAK